jgi:hypothetical protein
MMADDFDELMNEADELGDATLHDYVAGTPDVYGSAAFFASATETLIESTRNKRELGGACYFVRKRGAIVLVGLREMARGTGSHVAINPVWGSVLWHTHPGLSFSIAAFSGPDLDGARAADRPLLVIGYKSASPDVLGLTKAAEIVAGGRDDVTERLLRMGVAARICWPNGEVRPVRRYRREGYRRVIDEATFQVDRAIGAAARTVEPASLRALGGKLRGAIQCVRRRTRRSRKA